MKLFRVVSFVILISLALPLAVQAQQPIQPCSQGQGQRVCQSDGTSHSIPECRYSQEGGCLAPNGRYVSGQQRRDWRRDAQEANQHQRPGPGRWHSTPR